MDGQHKNKSVVILQTIGLIWLCLCFLVFFVFYITVSGFCVFTGCVCVLARFLITKERKKGHGVGWVRRRWEEKGEGKE